MKNKKTIVLGASPKPERYSNMAVKRLRAHGHDVVAIGRREGEIDGTPIIKDRPVLADIDTVTLYLNPQAQQEWYDYILAVKPRRIIFNPGTENPELEQMVSDHGIISNEACTLVMLSTNQY